MEVIIKYSGWAQDSRVEALGQGFGIIDIDKDEIAALSAAAWIEDIELPKLLSADITSALSASCIPSARAVYGLTGKGCAIAVIDTGIDYAHPEFIDSDGNTRLICLWDMSRDGTPPEGFRKGNLYSREEINEALQSPFPYSVIPLPDLSGHGTAVAGIAAGNNGAAPEAQIIGVKLSASDNEAAVSTDIMRALRFVIDTARGLDMPLAINISYGMNEGAHNGTSLFEEYITAVGNEWKSSVIIPTGNEGSAGHHFSGTMKSLGTESIDMFTSAGLKSFYLSIWKDFTDEISMRIVFPDLTISPELTLVSPEFEFRTGKIRVRGIYGTPTTYSVDQEVLWTFTAEDGFIPVGLWRIILRSGSIVNGRYNIWLPTVGQVSKETYFSSPENELTITIPSTAEKVIRVAGYDSRIMSTAEFSGVGTNNILPDIAAPAVRINAPVAGGGYGLFTGTSFASPFVAGSAALLMEWGIVRGNDPFFYGERIRAQLRLSAKRSSAVSYPNKAVGYGILCLSIPE